MMTNKEIAKCFELLAKLMELHGENPFKIKSYRNAYYILMKIPYAVSELDEIQLQQISGIGKAIASKIVECKKRGTFPALEKFLKKTPHGLLDLLKIKGLGPKKISLIWKELGVESLGELEYAIKENRLTLLKGFGQKTQDSILQQISFLESIKNSFLLYKTEPVADELLVELNRFFPAYKFAVTGDMRRSFPVVKSIDILSDIGIDRIKEKMKNIFEIRGGSLFFKNIKVQFVKTEKKSFGTDLFVSTGTENFVEKFKIINRENELDIFLANDIPYIPPVFRDNNKIIDNPQIFDEKKYIQKGDIKGIVHNHTTWSDGSNSVLDMATHCKNLGYEYIVISDHSRSAYYANGLKNEQIEMYLKDVKRADSSIGNFKIFSGIESDILIDGSLDYEEEMLSRFDVVIASIHSVLRMDKNKATNRLIKAIENPHTKILGHPTGRILLAREGYPVDYEAIFRACVEYDVVIELNANPHRLDIDWSLIDKAQDMGVKFSINPDAHKKEEIEYIKYGVLMAQKGGLLRENCLNTKDVKQFERWIGI